MQKTLEFIDCWKNRFSLYCTSDHVELEICARTAMKPEEHTRMLIAISLSMPASLSEIVTKFPLKDSFKLMDNIWCFFRTVMRFQQLCSFARWRNVRAWAWYSAWLAYKTLHSHLQLEIFIEFVVDEFAKLVLAINLQGYPTADQGLGQGQGLGSGYPPVQNCSPNSHRTCCWNVLSVFDVCSEINL